MSGKTSDRVDELLALLRVVARFYRSSYGKDLEPADWRALQEAVDAFDSVTDGLVLGQAPALPVLAQPATVVQALIDRKESYDHNRAYRLLDKYEFVFQLVRSEKLPGVGPKLARVLDAALYKLGVERGMDLGPYQSILNTETQPDYEVLREDRRLTSDGADFYFEYDARNTGYATIEIKFDTPDAVVARFQRQMWRTSVLDMEVESALRCDVHGDITSALKSAYKKDPKRLMKRPVRWILHHRTAFDERPTGRGWRQVQSPEIRGMPLRNWWVRNEVLWLAPGATPPKSETV